MPGITPADSMAIMGWSSYAMTTNYDHGDESIRVDAAQKVADLQKTAAMEEAIEERRENIIGVKFKNKGR